MNVLHGFCRSAADARWSTRESRFDVDGIMRSIVVAALEGKYMIAYTYPEDVYNSFVGINEGKKALIPAHLLKEYQTATKVIYDTFNNSPFVIELKKDGFLISWSPEIEKSVPMPVSDSKEEA